MPCVKVFDLLENRFRRNGKGLQRTEGRLKEEDGKLVKECAHPPDEECAVENQM